MTTVKELIDYLETLPRETEVHVVVGIDCGYGYGTKEVPLDLDPAEGNMEFMDFTGNKFVKEGSDLVNKKYLLLGEQFSDL